MKFPSRKIIIVRTLILFASYAYSEPLYAQSSGIEFEINELKFDKIAAIDYPPKTLEFKNISDKDMAILLIEKSTNVKVAYERRFYTPGENGILQVFYLPDHIGDFEEQINIFTNIDTQAVSITLHGTAVSKLECFPDPKNLLRRQIEVIDEITKQRIPNARISFIHNHNARKPIIIAVDKEGLAVVEMPIGLYNYEAIAQNYLTKQEEFFLPKSQPYVIIELKKIKLSSPPVAETSKSTNEEISTITKETPPAPVTITDLPEDLYAANNLIFLLDVSTSMRSGNKFRLLQQSINNLALILRPIDKVSIITYSNEAQIALHPVSGDEKDKITDVIQELQPYGITRGVKGLQTAYKLAEDQFIKDGNNLIILATDGEFSEKNLDDSYYTQLITTYTHKGISLSIMGFGINQEAINRMKIMTMAGGGNFLLIQSDEYVKDVLINEVKKTSFTGN